MMKYMKFYNLNLSTLVLFYIEQITNSQQLCLFSSVYQLQTNDKVTLG